MFETPHRHAVRVQPARAGRRPHPGAGRDRERQELPAQLPGHPRAEVRAADGGPRSRATATGSWPRCWTGATWSSASGSSDVTINPFALEPTPEHLHFLHAFVRVLLEGDDGYRLSDLEDREVYEAVENLYVLDRAPAPAVHAGQPAAARAGRPPAQVDRRRALRERSSTTSRTR